MSRLPSGATYIVSRQTESELAPFKEVARFNSPGEAGLFIDRAARRARDGDVFIVEIDGSPFPEMVARYNIVDGYAVDVIPLTEDPEGYMRWLEEGR